VLLPIVAVAITLTLRHDPETGGGLAKMGFGLFILGPGAGIAIGLIAVAALDLLRKRIGIRRDYESLYSLGVAFTAYAAAEAVHGSGFLAAFAAGITIAALDVELCDCFVEYGGVTAEMLLLFTFVIFGSSLIWTGFQGVNTRTVIFAAFAILIRVPVYLISLIGSHVETRGRMVIAWYGPSGLSSLLLILLPVFVGIPGSDQIFRICALIVLISIVIHGFTPTLLARFCSKDKTEETPEAEPAQPQPVMEVRSLPVIESQSTESVGTQSITLDEFEQLQKSGDKVILLDVRTERSREPSETQAKGSVRIVPEGVVGQAHKMKLPKDAWLIAYCA
jgi:NhaP-type Na+/H+ or K+/H+ antiporter